MKRKVYLVIFLCLLLPELGICKTNYIEAQDCHEYAEQATSIEMETFGFWQTLAALNNGEREMIYAYWFGYCEGSNSAGAEALLPVFV